MHLTSRPVKIRVEMHRHSSATIVHYCNCLPLQKVVRSLSALSDYSHQYRGWCSLHHRALHVGFCLALSPTFHVRQDRHLPVFLRSAPFHVWL